MGRKRVLNYDQIAQLCDEGRTAEEIAERVGSVPRSIREVLTKLGLRTPHRRQTLDHRRIASLYQRGISAQTIADQLGYSKAGVFHALRVAGIPTRSGDKRHDTIDHLGFAPTKEWAEELLRMHGTAADAARSCGLSYQTFYAYLRQFGIPRTVWRGGPGGNSRRQDIPVEEAIRRSEAGESYSRIATDLGVSYFVLSKRLREAGYRAPTNRMRKYPEDELWAAASHHHKKILRRLGITACEICGDSRVLDLAHIRPKHKKGPTEDNNSLVLCPTCHRLYDKQLLSKEELAKIKYKIRRAVKLYGDWR